MATKQWTAQDITAHRERLGLGKNAYARGLNIPRATLYNYENGVSDVTKYFDLIVKAAKNGLRIEQRKARSGKKNAR